MEVSLRVRRVEVEERGASAGIRSFFATEIVYLDDFTVTIPVYDYNGGRNEYTGSVFSTTREVAAEMRCLGLEMVDEERTEVLRHSDRPILRCLYKDGDAIRICGLRRLVAGRERLGNSIFAKAMSLGRPWVERLKRLCLAGCSLKKVPDLSMVSLEHLDLRHNIISGEVHLEKRFNSVNLSHNRILRFTQSHRFQRLDLSHNPLSDCFGEARVLNLSHTRVRFFESRNVRKLFVDGTEEIRLGMFENLVFLSMNGCNVRDLSLEARKLRVLKAKGNLIEVVPFFPDLEYLDISGNLVHKILSKGVKFLDASRNQIMALSLCGWDRLVRLDLSYNPLVSLEDSGAPSLKFMSLRGMTIRSLKWGELKHRYDAHACERKRKVVERFVVDLEGKYGRLFLISMHDAGVDVGRIVEMVKQAISQALDPQTYFEKFSEMLRKILFAAGIVMGYVGCMVTPRHVLFNGRGVGVMFSSFAEVKVFDDPEIVGVYDNVGNWHIIPMLCSFRGSTARFDIVDTLENDLGSVLDFVGHRCPLSAVMTVSNFPGICSPDEVIGGMECKVELPIQMTYEEALAGTMAKQRAPGWMNGCENYNFVLRGVGRRHYDALLLNPNPVFGLCRLVPRDTQYQYVTGNVRNIMKMMSAVFHGTVVESFSDLWIVVFHDRVEACLWGLRVEKILKHLGIDVGVGITCGPFYTKISGSHVRFYGPVLNKAARIAKLGIGVFCCHCVWTKHPRVVYIDQGLRSLRGFREPHPIYTPKLSEEG